MVRIISTLAGFVALAAAVPMNILSAPIVAVDPTTSGFRIPIINPEAQNIIENRFIVAFNSSFDDDAISSVTSFYTAAIKKRNLNKRSTGTGRILSTTINSFKLNQWRAMALDADDDMITEIFNSPEVAYIEADTKVHLNDALAQTNAPPWSQPSLPRRRR
jgi:hypothetical protein